jgi:hypothetical protein
MESSMYVMRVMRKSLNISKQEMPDSQFISAVTLALKHNSIDIGARGKYSLDQSFAQSSSAIGSF